MRNIMHWNLQTKDNLMIRKIFRIGIICVLWLGFLVLTQYCGDEAFFAAETERPSLISPSPGVPNQSGTTEFQWNTVANAKFYRLYIDGIMVYEGPECSFTTSLEAGDFTIIIEAVGNGVLSQTSEISLLVVDAEENNPPTITIENPLQNSILSSSQTLGFSAEGQAIDDSGIFQVEVAIDDGEYIVASGLENWNCSLDLSTLSEEEPHTLKIKAYDNCANIGEASVTFFISDAPVVIYYNNFEAEDVISSDFVLRGQFAFISPAITMTIAVDGGVGEPIQFLDADKYLWSAALGSMVVGEGEHTFTIHLVCENGQEYTKTFKLTKDDQIPLLEINYPEDNTKVPGQFNITGTCSDNLEMSHVKLSIIDEDLSDNNLIWSTMKKEDFEGFSVPVDLSASPQKEYLLTVQACDQADNCSYINNRITLDHNLPSITFTNLLPNQWVLENFVVKGEVFENVDMDSFTIQINDMDPEPIILTAGELDELDFMYTIQTDLLTDGDHEITATAYDSAGNETSITLPFRLDRISPEITLNGLNTGDILNGTISINGQATDDRSSVLLKYSIDQISWKEITPVDPYSILFNSATLIDGSHEFYLKARDESFNETILGPIPFYSDNHFPEIEITYPASLQRVGQIITVEGTASDEVELQDVRYDIDGGVATSLGNSSDISFNLDTSLFSDGEHKLNFEVEDSAGLIKYFQRTFYIDNTFPLLTVSHPAEATIVSNTIMVVGDTSDNDGIASVEVQIDGAGYAFANGLENFGYTIDTLSLSNGDHLIEIKSTDLAGNETVVSLTIEVDNESPVIVISDPTENELISGVYPASGTTNDNTGIAEVRYRVDLGGWSIATGTDNFSFDLVSSSLGDGSHTLFVEALDDAGNIITSSVTFQSDNTAPDIIITTPVEMQYFKNSLSSSGTAQDNLDVVQVQISIDGAPFQDAIGEEIWYKLIDCSGLSETSHSFAVKASDTAGNIAIEERLFRVDHTMPDFEILAPENNSLVNGLININGTSGDNVLVSAVEIKVDEESWEEALGQQNWSYSLDTSSWINNSTHTITARAIDHVGNIRMSSISVIKDGSIPSITIDQPLSGDYISGIINITGTASDDGAVNLVEVKIDTGSWNTASGTNNWSYSYNCSALSEGYHTIKARATDDTAKQAIYQITVGKDTTPPSVDLTSPIDGSYVKGNVFLQADADDNMELETVEFSTDGGMTWHSGTNENDWKWEWDTTSFADGGYDLIARATDKAGNFSETSVITVYSDNTIPIVSMDTPPIIDSYNRQILNLSGTASDNINIENIYVRFERSGFESPNEEAIGIDPWSYSIDTNLFTDEYYLIRVTAIDSAGNEAYATRSIYIDNTSPGIIITHPASSGQWYRSAYNIRGTSSDNMIVDVVHIRLQRSGWDSGWMGVSGIISWSKSINTASYGDYDYTLSARACDEAGNCTTTSKTMRFDNTDPYISSTNPSNGSTIRPGTSPIRVYFADTRSGVNRSSLSLGDDMAGECSYNWSGNQLRLYPNPQWNARNGGGNGNRLSISIRDNVGNEHSWSLHYPVILYCVDQVDMSASLFSYGPFDSPANFIRDVNRNAGSGNSIPNFHMANYGSGPVYGVYRLTGECHYRDCCVDGEIIKGGDPSYPSHNNVPELTRRMRTYIGGHIFPDFERSGRWYGALRFTDCTTYITVHYTVFGLTLADRDNVGKMMRAAANYAAGNGYEMCYPNFHYNSSTDRFELHCMTATCLYN